jgi:AbrB family looped-hinge helix DNA binding protein
MSIVKTTEKGQVVIPAKIRKRYHITKGTKVIILDKDGQIIIKPLLKEPIKQARGFFKQGASALKALMEDRDEEAKH